MSLIYLSDCSIKIRFLMFISIFLLLCQIFLRKQLYFNNFLTISLKGLLIQQIIIFRPNLGSVNFQLLLNNWPVLNYRLLQFHNHIKHYLQIMNE